MPEGHAEMEIEGEDCGKVVITIEEPKIPRLLLIQAMSPTTINKFPHKDNRFVSPTNSAWHAIQTIPGGLRDSSVTVSILKLLVGRPILGQHPLNFMSI